jgi:hypothetical protein
MFCVQAVQHQRKLTDIDKNFIWTRLLYWDLLVLDGTTSLFDDLRPLLTGYIAHNGFCEGNEDYDELIVL